MTLADATTQWVNARVARREINELTARSYRRHLHSFADHIGARQVAEISTEDFEAWLGAQNVAGSTLNTMAAPVRAFFGWCAVRGHTDADPTLGVPRARTAKPYPRRLPPDTIRKLLIVSDFRGTVILMLGLHLGLRCCEMSRFQVEWWDRENGTVDVHGKGDKWRTMPVAGEVEQVLSLWVLNLDGNRGPVFPSQANHADPVNPNTISSIVTASAKRARVQATAHRLRHTFGWTAMASGVPFTVVQALMGHSNPASTGIYTAAGIDDLREHMGNWNYLAAH